MALFLKRQGAAFISALTTFRSGSCAAGGSLTLVVGTRRCGVGARISTASSYASSPLAFQSTSSSSSTPTSFLTRRHHQHQRYLSSSSNVDNGSNIKSSPITLPIKTGDRNGLIRHEVIADDGHPLRVYSRTPRHINGESNSADLLTTGEVNKQHHQRSILLLHGRTWSSQPVFDLRTSDEDTAQQSTLQSLTDLGFHVYALDLRGFGETPRDVDAETGSGGYTTPRRCVADVKCVIDWITKKHGVEDDDDMNVSTSIPGFEDPTVISTKPALLGWSQGALVAQMYAQQHGPSTLSDLILFGSIFDPKVIYPRKPLYDPQGRLVSGPDADVFKPPAPEVLNTDIASLEDFTLPGTICDEAALTFSSLALAVDPIKAAWDELHEFNICNPALIHIPTLVIVGAQDPYVSWEAQRELFERLGTEDKAMCVLPGCDHAAHILKARKMFVRGVAGFLLRKDVF